MKGLENDGGIIGISGLLDPLTSSIQNALDTPTFEMGYVPSGRFPSDAKKGCDMSRSNSVSVSQQRERSVASLERFSPNAFQQRRNLLDGQGVSDILFDLRTGFSSLQNQVHPFFRSLAK